MEVTYIDKQPYYDAEDLQYRPLTLVTNTVPGVNVIKLFTAASYEFS